LLILQTKQITKSFGVDPILLDINLQINSQERIGLVGVNGAGKSTLLKIIAGEILPDSGNVDIGKGVKIGYLAQDSGLDTNRTIWEEMKTVFSHLLTQEKYIRELEDKMSQPSLLNDEVEYQRLMNEYAKQIDDFRDKGGYSYEAQIRGILHGLGFNSYDYNKQSIYTLSGGQKTRLALAKLLLEAPHLLILDEPTNYLDIETLTWLEGYLKTYSGAVLVVSHDRYFLDALVTIIYEIEQSRAIRFVGNYSQYIDQKAKQLETMMKQYEQQQDEIAKLEQFIQKNIARASTTRRAQSKRKLLDKMDRMDRPLSEKNAASFSFDIEKMSGNNVLMVKDLAMSFNNNKIFENVSFQINRGDRVALVGPNGIGKSTLFKLISTSKWEPNNGHINFGSNVTLGYYDQEQEQLNLENKLIDEVWNDYLHLTEKEVRTLLGNFLFIGDDVFKKIKDLSGGEKARVSLAKLMLKNANLLLLDEPTNHLDIYSREVLENALVDYPGTIFFISHDRYFLNRIATRTIELEPSGVTNYLGNYQYYLEKKAEIEEEKQSTEVKEASNEEKSNKLQFQQEKEKQKIERQLRRKVATIEEEIEQHEEKISKIEQELLQPEVYMNHEISLTKNEELNKYKTELEDLLLNWEEAQKELEGY